MSRPLMTIKQEDLDTLEKRKKYTVCVVGCGDLGILQTVLFADAGFKVICFDSNQTVVNNIAKGKVAFSGDQIEGVLRGHIRTDRVTVSSDLKQAVSQSDVVAITIPAKIDSKKKVDYSTIEGICKRVGSGLRLGSLVIIMRVAGVGIIEGIIREALENSSGYKAGIDFGLAYSPFLSAAGGRIIGSNNKNSLDLASAILAPTTKGASVTTGNVRAVELAALFDVQQRDVNIALANELAMLSEKLGADSLEAITLLKGIGHDLFSPTLSVRNTKEDPYFLLADAENQNMNLRVSSVAREVNEHFIKHLVNLVKDGLKSSGKPIRRARISLLGLSQAPNVKNQPKRIARDLAQSLMQKGARIAVYDPYFTEKELSESFPNPKKSLAEAIEGADCVVILTGHDQFKRLSLKKLKLAMKKQGTIVDFEGIVEPDKLEKEGLIYRGLGRGVWTR